MDVKREISMHIKRQLWGHIEELYWLLHDLCLHNACVDPNCAAAAKGRELLDSFEGNFGFVPNYPPPLIDTNPFDLIEGKENKLY